MICYYVWKHRERIHVPGAIRPMFVPIMTVATAIVTQSISITIWIIAFSSILIVAKGGRGPVERTLSLVLDNRHVQTLGRYSYSIYLCHTIVITLSLSIFGSLAMRLGQFGFLTLMIALVFPTSLALSHLLYHCVELPANQFARGLARRLSGNIPS